MFQREKGAGDNKGITKGAADIRKQEPMTRTSWHQTSQNELIEAHFTKLKDTTHEEDVAYVNYSLDKKQPLSQSRKEEMQREVETYQ